MTAAEAVAMFEANPELVASREREREARLVRARADNEAAREVYEDLAAVGVEVSRLDDILRTPGYSALAGVMSQAARKAQLPDLMEMVQDSSLPPTRGMFVGKVLRLGGEEGLALIESLKDDPDVGLEATARLKMRQRRRQAGMKRPPETSSN